MPTDLELLQSFAKDRDESSFREFVSRHGGQIQASAMRQLQDRMLAEEVAQNVFCLVAKKAAQLTRHPAPEAWLYRVTRLECLHVLRSERRRRAREQSSDLMNVSDPEPPWNQIQPLLDEALDSLGEADRRTLLMRFFYEKSFRDISDSLGVTEDAAKMRVGRSLEKLRGFFARRGIAATTATFSLLLAKEAPAATLPPLLSSAWSTHALSSTASSGYSLTTFIIAMSSQKVTLALVAAALILPAGLKWGSVLASSHTAGSRGTGSFASSPSADRDTGTRAPARASSARSSSVSAGPLAKISQALSRADLLENDYPRMLALNQLVLQLDPSQYQEALAILTHAGSSTAAENLTSALFSRWAETAPREALAVASSCDRTLRDRALGGALGVLMREDTENAVAAISQEFNDYYARREILDIAFQQLAPQDALKHLGLLTDPTLATQVKSHALIQWAAVDDKQAWEWASNEDDPLTRESSEQKVIVAVGGKNPERGVALALSMTNPDTRATMLDRMLFLWERQDTRAAMQSFISLPPEILNRRELTNVSIQFAYRDPEGTSEMISKMPQGAQRNQMARFIAQSWMDKDPEAARRWIQSCAEIPESQKSELLNPKKP